jgi:hypothetical protein
VGAITHVNFINKCTPTYTNNIESKEPAAEEIGTILSVELCTGEDESISH